MRKLIRQPLTWMVVAECVVVALLFIVVWNVVASASSQRPAGAPVPAVDAPAVDAPAVAVAPSLPDLTAAGPPTPVQLPGLNLDARFWRLRLNQLNRDQVFFEQLEWRILHNAMDAAQGYLETVVLPSITHAERA
jgi:hypothetical protein